MRFGEIFRFEVWYRLRQPSTWIYAVFMLALAVFTVHQAVADAPTAPYANAPHFITLWAILISLGGMVATAAIFGDAATRDVRTGMHPLVHTTALRKTEYLGGRFLAAFVVSLLLLTIFWLFLAITSRMPWLNPERLGPFRLIAYVQPYLLFLLPNLLLTGAILFTIAALTRHTLAAYLGGIALFFGYMAGTDQINNRNAHSTLYALSDPFGIGAIEDLTRYWTVAERNTRLLGAADIVVWNRVIWILVAVGVLWFLYTRFRLGHLVEGDGKRRRTITEPGETRVATVPLHRVAGTFDVRTQIRQTLAVARLSLREMARSKALFLIIVWTLLIIFNMGFNLGVDAFGSKTWPVTHLVAGTIDNVSLPIMLLIAIFAGELVWKERDLKMSEIADAAPVSEAAALAGRFLALVVMLATIQLIFLGAGVLIQALQGYYRFELGLYAQIMLGIGMVNYVLFAALAMTLHVVVNQRYVGIFITVLCFVFMIIAPQLGVLRHNLLVYGGDPGWIYSDMNGFGPFLAPFVWTKLYWAAWALLLAVAARLLWVRGWEPGMRGRLREARRRLAGPTVRVAAVAVALIVSTGGFVFYNTNVLNDYRSPLEAAELNAAYERQYKRYEHAPLPRIVAANVRVEIYPEDGAADLRGTYTLVNRTTEPVDSVHVTINPAVEARSITLDRGARPLQEDGELTYRIYALEHPLAPGDSMRLDFDVEYRPRGFPNRGVPTAVVANGAYFDRRWLPIIGYLPSLEETSEEMRRRLGLPPRAPMPSNEDAEAMLRLTSPDADRVQADVVIGTAADQIAVTPGTLRRSWTENGRRYFHYRTEEPLSFGMATLSGRYAVREDTWRDVALKIYYHPTHAFNVDRVMRSMKSSLEYFTGQFGPYQFKELRVVEFPRYESFARAHPHTIAFSEGDMFLQRVREGDMDLPFYAVAHETAHQWWGGQVAGANAKGRGFLSEGLANYSAMMVTEEVYGLERARDFYKFQMDRYLRVRGAGIRGPETTLLDVETEPHIFYAKGAIAMYTLREHLGADAVNTALRRYFAKYSKAGAPLATSRDLYAELRAVTPDSLHGLLRDLFEDIVLWDVSAEEARVEPVGDGSYRVTLAIEAKKVRADSIGNETEVPMDDLVEIGVFAPAGNGNGPGEPLYLERHRIGSGKQTITVTVPRQPASAGIDPRGKLIQRNADDNLVDVEAVTAAPPGR
jgi:ABC-type transport system involved in multi-copper enzyme maturation permease subunit